MYMSQQVNDDISTDETKTNMTAKFEIDGYIKCICGQKEIYGMLKKSS